MKTHVPTEAQEKAFNKVIKAMKEAKKLGLVFYGKEMCLVAYTQQASAYQENNLLQSYRGEGSEIPYLSGIFLNDSSADDYARYITLEDEEKFKK